MLVKSDVIERAAHLGVLALLVVDQVAHDAALEQVLGHDLVHILHLDVGIEGAFRVDDNHGARFAQAKAAGFDDADFLVKAVLRQFLVKALVDFVRAGRGAAGAAAHQDMRAIEIHLESPLLSDIGLGSAAIIYSTTGLPLTMCSVMMRLALPSSRFT